MALFHFYHHYFTVLCLTVLEKTSIMGQIQHLLLSNNLKVDADIEHGFLRDARYYIVSSGSGKFSLWVGRESGGIYTCSIKVAICATDVSEQGH